MTLETDILGGVQLGFKTILVLSGSTRREELSRYAYRPDKVVESIADLDYVQLLRELSSSQTADMAKSPPPLAKNYRALVHMSS